ncbi:hypothetical protein BT96DRAFT_986397 [Gymnopus androsaceus JB14]|uniref:Chitin synthase export chaperone n=1 Tax=Gymnopus androsaceus JB14 TaxID=1447944 RepID=A0A6A4IG57_9AGAR|nr:hypothetical protein BT96DRAFT_986397 [Gymnopus androsaceus JB14]
MACSSPVPNSDISGIGVRVSFYLQYVLAVLSCAASPEVQEVEDALLTICITNIAYCVTTLLLSFRTPPQLTLYDGLVVIYLTLFTLGYVYFITILYVKMKGFHYMAYIVAIVQCYFVLCTFLAIMITLPSFGSEAPCNYERVASIFFVPVSMHTFRIIGLTTSTFFIVFGTVSIIVHRIYFPGSYGSREYFITEARHIDKTIKIHILMNSLTFTLCIAHVETLQLFNHPESGVDSSWGFGQASVFDDV